MILTEKDAAKKIGVSTKTLRRWRDSGIGPKYFQRGVERKKTFYKSEAISEFINGIKGRNIK